MISISYPRGSPVLFPLKPYEYAPRVPASQSVEKQLSTSKGPSQFSLLQPCLFAPPLGDKLPNIIIITIIITTIITTTIIAVIIKVLIIAIVITVVIKVLDDHF